MCASGGGLHSQPLYWPCTIDRAERQLARSRLRSLECVLDIQMRRPASPQCFQEVLRRNRGDIPPDIHREACRTESLAIYVI